MKSLKFKTNGNSLVCDNITRRIWIMPSVDNGKFFVVCGSYRKTVAGLKRAKLVAKFVYLRTLSYWFDSVIGVRANGHKITYWVIKSNKGGYWSKCYPYDEKVWIKHKTIKAAKKHCEKHYYERV